MKQSLRPNDVTAMLISRLDFFPRPLAIFQILLGIFSGSAELAFQDPFFALYHTREHTLGRLLLSRLLKLTFLNPNGRATLTHKTKYAIRF